MKVPRSMLVDPGSARADNGPRVSRSACWSGALPALLVAACAAEMSLPQLGALPREPSHVPANSTAVSAAPIVAVAAAPKPTIAQAAPAGAAKPDWRLLLEDGIDSYENGAYGNAIRKLNDVANNPQADDAARVKALKYLAFSYCVSPDPPASKAAHHLTLCRQTFARALALDPEFDLAPGERGHPVWGKEFVEARRERTKRTPSKGGDATDKKNPSAAGGATAALSKP